MAVEYDDTGAEGQSLDDEMHGLVADMANIAEIRHCFIETDLHERDTDRSW